MKIVILTGAGISAESGIQTFRGSNGLWNGMPVEDVATPEGFNDNPDMVLEFYNERRRQLALVEPNAAHVALAKLQQSHHEVHIITQNVDDLHERGGSPLVFHMHGSLGESLCSACGNVEEFDGDMTTDDKCSECGSEALRPNIVWFGEIPYYLDLIDLLLMECDVFVAIGTSGTVYPAANMVNVANRLGAITMEFNLDGSGADTLFDIRAVGPATETVPMWVDQITKI